MIFEHPESAGLNSEEYRERAIGNMMLAYRKGDEIWGVAKIFDADAAQLMQTTHRSTSPGVTPPRGSTSHESEDGTKVLAEGLPLVLDHLAVCERGVWDKNSDEPQGIRLDAAAAKEQPKKMTPEEEEKLKRERDDAVKRADAFEAKEKEREDKSKKDADEAMMADKKRKDAEETERQAVEKAEKEKADAKRADRSKRHDSEKHDGMHADCARCDSFEKGDVNDSAASVETVKAEIDKLHDARKAEAAAHAAEIVALTTRLDSLMRQPTHDDANQIATAFHRADSVYQMLGEVAPRHLHGETPIAYRRRLADGLRKHSPRWKTYAFHDSVVGQDFDLIEDSIYADALAAAKNPVINDSNTGRLIERTTVQNGKTRTEFFGDSAVAFAPFEAPVMSFKFKKPATAGKA